jgi:hypothetical protein
LFEIKFVQHQDPFYQLGKLYVYKLQVELFQYASERIDTGIKEVDAFESLKSFTTNTTRSPYGEVIRVDMTHQGNSYTSVPTVAFASSTGFGAEATAVLGSGDSAGKVVAINVTSGGTKYQTPPVVTISGGGGTGAMAVSIVEANIDKVESFGDNNSYKTQAADILFSENNPFGEVDKTRNRD